MTRRPQSPSGAVRRTARACLWLLPVYAVLLALSTLTHEPDHGTDFTAWSRYVTTDVFVVSHLVGSILGAGLGLVGILGATVFLARGAAPVTALVGAGLTIVANTLFSAMFGAAAFAQPAIGRAHLAGDSGMPELYDKVYGVALFTTFAVGALLFLAGAIVFGTAVARTSPDLRRPGYAYAAALCLYLVTGFTISVLQPVAGLAAAVAATVSALRLPRAREATQAPPSAVPSTGV